jgi:hypothetical protein
VKIGSLSVSLNSNNMQSGADNVPPMMERYLTGLRISGPGNFAINFGKIVALEDSVIASLTAQWTGPATR